MKKLQNDDNWRLLHDLTSYHITKGNLSFLKWSNNMMIPTLLDGTSIRLNIYNNKSGEVGLIDCMNSGGRVVNKLPVRYVLNYIEIRSLCRFKVGPTSSVALNQRWEMTLVQCTFAHRHNVAPTYLTNIDTMSHTSSSYVGPILSQR